MTTARKGLYLGIAAILILAAIGVLPFFNRPRPTVITFNPPPVPADLVGKYPNILLVIADDMGLDADPCQPTVGAEKPHMPNLEALCRRGVTFDNVWVNPVCSPTRATMMSGQYGFRTGVLDVDQALSPDVESLADVLTNNVPVPYANAFIGKWHLSGPNASLNAPAALGVQYFAGFLAGGVRDYFNYRFVEQGIASHERTYTTTLFTDKAIAWLEQQSQRDPNRPWFLWLAYNAPHMPFHLPPAGLISDQSLSGSASDIEQNPRPYYFAALEALDTEMGRLLATLSPAELANTVILFVGDNGTPGEVIQPPYTAAHAKASVYNGGVWGVLTVAGRDVTRQGVHDSALINGTDLFATVADLAGSEQTRHIDSTSFKAALTSANYHDRSFLYTEWEPARGPKPDMWAVRDVRYKLINYSNGSQELYDLASDPYENNNLLQTSLSTDLTQAQARLESYKQSLSKPLF